MVCGATRQVIKKRTLGYRKYEEMIYRAPLQDDAALISRHFHLPLALGGLGCAAITLRGEDSTQVFLSCLHATNLSLPMLRKYQELLTLSIRN